MVRLLCEKDKLLTKTSGSVTNSFDTVELFPKSDNLNSLDTVEPI